MKIPENIDQNIHLRIAFYYKKNYDKMKQEKGPFALAFARIMEGATLIGDGIHELLVYKVGHLCHAHFEPRFYRSFYISV